jgi:hypothetical protein
MGNVNETASETAHSGSVNAKELPGALQTGEDDAANPGALTVGVLSTEVHVMIHSL